jgi:peptidoglycan/xylan/chitin deacetylase (PgdA/CDA1 family)
MSAAILTYHNIGKPPIGSKMRGLYVTPLMFRFQMWYLKAGGFKVVPLSEIVRFLSCQINPERPVAITFDDGYQDFYDRAFPVLRRYGFPATVFLVSALIGNGNAWDSDVIGVSKKLMGRDAIIELIAAGVEFGSHTRTHPFLTGLSGRDLEDEIRGSRVYLEDTFSIPFKYFCYPYGDFNDTVAEEARNAGYLCALTERRGFVYKGDNPFRIKRVPVKYNTHPLSFTYKIHSDYEIRKGADR